MQNERIAASGGPIVRTVAVDAAADSVAAEGVPAAWTAGPGKATVLLWLWGLGSAAILALSLRRISSFDRLIRNSSQAAEPVLQRMTARLSESFGLRRVPEVRIVQAEITPLVWWVGGRVRIVLPASIVDGLNPRALRLIVAHELAHVSRGDHRVRLVEWAAGVAAWWCPVLWFARRGLRRNEELCCDALVVERLAVSPNMYAGSILDAIELLAAPVLRPPALASKMTSGGTLEHRLTMIVSDLLPAPKPSWMRQATLVFAALVLPFGIARAQAPDYEAVGARLIGAVESGELSESQAKVMLGALAAEHFEELLAARRTLREERRGVAVLRGGSKEGRAERYSQIERELKAAVERGEATPVEAERRLIEARIIRYIDRQGAERKSALETADFLLEHENAARDLEAMMKAGQMSRQDAGRRVEGLPGELPAPEWQNLSRDIERLSREIKNTVAGTNAKSGGNKDLEAAVRHMREEITGLGALVRGGKTDPGVIETYRKGLLDQDLPSLERLGAGAEIIERFRTAIKNAGCKGLEACDQKPMERESRSEGSRRSGGDRD